MIDYKEMYFKLFHETSKAIEILKNVQLECEEMYISGEDAQIILLDQQTKRTDN